MQEPFAKILLSADRRMNVRFLCDRGGEGKLPTNNPRRPDYLNPMRREEAPALRIKTQFEP